MVHAETPSICTEHLTNQMHQLGASGFSVVPDLIGSEELDLISRCIEHTSDGNVGTRRLIDVPWCNALARRRTRDHRLHSKMPIEAVPVQCTLFVKTIEKNWLVSLHQDLSIPVAERVSNPACSGWSEKEGRVFVQPPMSVPDTILAVRIHLDACDDSNGALRVVPGSHRLGRLTALEARKVRDARGETSVAVPRGGAMLMRPLLLHASSKTSVDKVRRVLHFVFGPAKLPGDLRWPCAAQ
jgi:ectoine hydroxylase-related dioxygenase (phytanoyl-CoA dioxygenase family)